MEGTVGRIWAKNKKPKKMYSGFTAGPPLCMCKMRSLTGPGSRGRREGQGGDGLLMNFTTARSDDSGDRVPIQNRYPLPPKRGGGGEKDQQKFHS